MSISNEQKASFILSGFIITEGAFVLINFYINGIKFWHYLGFGLSKNGSIAGWALAFIVAAMYIVRSSGLPAVREQMFKISFLKLLALAVAVFAGILEEVLFRKWIMDFLLNKGYGNIIQVLASGFCFGAVHGIWGLFGNKRAAIGATIATSSLGTALAVVFLIAGRVLAPCIVSHFLINLFIEPGLALAAVKRQMGRKPAVTE